MADDNRNVEDFFQLGKELGRGAFAVVFKATENATGEERAIKRVLKSKVTNAENLRREVSILKKVSSSHKGINTLHDIFEDDKYLYLVLDFVSGGELFDHIIEAGNYSEDIAANITRQMIEALAFLHENKICHRDIKPENLLCTKLGEGQFEIQLADFGLGRFFEEGANMETRVGSPEYVAPEILNGVKYTELVDMWSAGVVVYILLTGFLPFFDKDQARLYRKIKRGSWDWKDCPPVSDTGKDFVSRLLVTDPATRMTPKEALEHPWLKSKHSKKKVMSSGSFRNLRAASQEDNDAADA